eukprot:CAMPEP_0119478014 /NCGR_PEP_ID=MMETSP1344-20130328/7949_1 /TAXON_ID=236787 /ORGANISM="Florenciella parvula, Strain CCMP2471" /LENGTH=128 /DNA_ID=CAMNT_0007512155 /DNA_START=413 /DNA_END=799 /DNA_ORIENTATION=+
MFSFTDEVPGEVDGLVGPKTSHYRYLVHQVRPIRAHGGCQTLSELSDPYCFQSLSYSCPHALTGNHVLRGGTAAAPLRAQRVVRDQNIAGPPKSNPFATKIPFCCCRVWHGQQPSITGLTDLTLFLIN